MKERKTHRGFTLVEFEDIYGEKCSIQNSSLATEPAVWLGLDEVPVQVLASQAKDVGVDTKQTTGWVDYPLPAQVFVSGRIHINVDLAKQIIEKLQTFVDTGKI